MREESFVVDGDIGAELVRAGLITVDQLAVAEENRKNLGGDLGRIMIEKGFITEEDLKRFLYDVLKIPFVSLDGYPSDPDVAKLVPVSLINKYHFVPLSKKGDILTIAISEPLEVLSLSGLCDVLKCKIMPLFASHHDVDVMIRNCYRMLSQNAYVDNVEVVQYNASSGNEDEDLQKLASGSNIIAEVNRIIGSAVREEASDIHIEPQSSSLKVRNRVDGLLEERMILPKGMHLPIVTRIKILGGMDIAERRVPQDGRVRIKFSGELVDMRISTYPTMFGEKVVIRLLMKRGLVGLEGLGFADDERKLFDQIISHPHGIFLVTGPTGSGKTTTLYAALQRLNSQDKNIVSIEDPIENEITGVNQAQVNVKAGMTFASALRSILRQDPDIIMVGEIRDGETADMAVRSAITGHFVLSTIHTNTALGAIARLVDLGVEPFLISSALIGIMSQRLVRRVCPYCKKEVEIEKVKLEMLGLPPNSVFVKGQGCKKCRMSGYSGRLALFKIVYIDDELKSMIASAVSEDKLEDVIKNKGLLSLREKGLQCAMKGLTTLDEVLRTTESKG